MKQQTIRDVASAAGVSIATVSRVLALDGSSRVSEKTRLRVKEAVKKLGYRPNHTARSLKTRSTRTVAILAPELANDFFMELAEGIERELNTDGYTMIIASSENSIEEEKKQISILADRMVDGIVVISAGYRGEHFKAIARQGLPLVLVDRFVEGADLDIILSDNKRGAFELTQRLLADGLKKIAFVGGNSAIPTAHERFSGFVQALSEGKSKTEPKWISMDGMRVEDGYRGMEIVLKDRRHFDALVAVNNMVHLGMEQKILELPSKKASSIVIAAFDKTQYTSFLPACRYIAVQDVVSIGKKAGQRIIERIKLKKQKKNVRCRIIRIPVSITSNLKIKN